MAQNSSNLPSWAKHLDFTIIDLLCLAGSFVLAYWLKFGNLGFVDSDQWKGLLVLLLLSDLVITLLTGPYSGIFRRSYWEDVGASLKLAIWSFLAACVVFYLLKIGEAYSREMLVTTFVVYLLLSLVLKALWKRFLLTQRNTRPADSVRRAILVTSARDARSVEEAAYADDMNALEITGFCLATPDDERYGKEGELSGRPYVAPALLPELAAFENADEVIVAVDPAFVPMRVYDALVEDGVRVRFAIAEALGVASETQQLGRAGIMKTLDLERYSFGASQAFYLPVKRLFDIAFGGIGCIALLPVAGVTKLVYLTSGDRHPIFYKQVRIGQRGKEFNMWKLRSMAWNADEMLVELLRDPALRAEWERDQKLANDPRITPVGRFLRRTSLDELPQFVNVLKGEMSVVGPRPLVPGELEEHGGRALYNKVKPGITGWWGCNGRSNIDYRERLELEYHYVKHCSLYLDVLCVVRTFVAVLKKEGAK